MAMEMVVAEVAATRQALAGLRAAITRFQGKVSPISARTEHVIRLGNLFLTGYQAESFCAALGYQRRRGRPAFRIDWTSPAERARRTAFRYANAWRAFTKSPPIKVGDKTYAAFTQFFSDHWPAVDWPADIPRPPKNKKEAA